MPYADTDQMGVVYYANYLVLFERARNELLRDGGLTYATLESLGWGLPVIEANVRYRSPAFYDDLLEIHAWITEIDALKVTVHCCVLREGSELASGFTKHIFMDLKSKRPRRVSSEVQQIFGRLMPV